MTFDFEKTLLENMKRLRDDSSMLLEGGRYTSAVALALIALEEAGKLAVERWRQKDFELAIYRRHGAHVAKQLAIFGLLCAARIKSQVMANTWELFTEVSSEFAKGGFSAEGTARIKNHNKELLSSVAEIISKSDDGKNFTYSEWKVFQEIKHICLYVDTATKTGITFKDIESDSAKYFVDLASRAIDVVQDETSLEVARAMIESRQKNSTHRA